MVDLSEEFLRKDFDVESYAKKLLEETESIPEQLASLAVNTAALDRQLKEQISNHYEQLLSQATSIESLEDILTTLSQHINALQFSVNRACEKVSDLYRMTEVRTLQLQRLHETCSLLRNVIRVLQLSSRLTGTSSGSGTAGITVTAGKDLVKNSQIMQELRDVCAECDLRNLKIVEKEMAEVQKRATDITSAARLALKQGAKTQNLPQIGAALQAFYNLKCLDAQLDGYGRELLNEAKLIVKNFDGLAAVDEARGTDGSSSGPGSAAVPAVQASITVRTNVWNDVNRVVEFLVSICSQLSVVHTVTVKKRESSSHMIFSELINEQHRFYAKIWTNVCSELKKAFQNAGVIVRQSLEGEYPRLLRFMCTVFNKLQQCKNLLPNAENELRNSLALLETSYLSKSLARLFDSVNLAFLSTSDQFAASIPLSSSRSEIDAIVRTIGDELKVAKFDPSLFDHTCKNVAKTLKLFGVKAEQLFYTDSDATQIIGNLNAGQKRNVDLINGLHYLRLQVMRCVEQQQDDVLLANVIEPLENLHNLMKNGISPLIGSIKDAINAILITMHQENFDDSHDSGGDGSNNDERSLYDSTQQCSLYIRELQDFVARVWRDYLSIFECSDLIRQEAISLAASALKKFMTHASLVRLSEESGKLRMISDFAQVELALTPFCRNVADDLGDLFLTFKAFRSLYSADPRKILDDSRLGAVLPYSLVIQLMISLSPNELPSPYTSAGWTLAKYADWFVFHGQELERLQFLKGTLEAYARQVQQEGKKSYVNLYPTLLELLKRGFDSNVPC